MSWLITWRKRQQLSQQKAREKANQTGVPIDDGYGTRWYPSSTAGPTPTMDRVKRDKEKST